MCIMIAEFCSRSRRTALYPWIPTMLGVGMHSFVGGLTALPVLSIPKPKPHQRSRQAAKLHSYLDAPGAGLFDESINGMIKLDDSNRSNR